jgi:hypothetical protein
LGDAAEQRIDTAIELAGQEEVEPIAITLGKQGRQPLQSLVGIGSMHREIGRDGRRRRVQFLPVTRQPGLNVAERCDAPGRIDRADPHLVRDGPAGLIGRCDRLELVHWHDALLDESGRDHPVDGERPELGNDEQRQQRTRGKQQPRQLARQ